jgi:hypothetical protein
MAPTFEFFPSLQAPRASEAGADGLQQQQPDGAGTGRRLLAVKMGGGGAAVHGSMGLQEAASARLCVTQCLQHACIAWHKVYMGEAGSSLAAAAAVPATAADCMLQCGMPAVESSCLAQVRCCRWHPHACPQVGRPCTTCLMIWPACFATGITREVFRPHILVLARVLSPFV